MTLTKLTQRDRVSRALDRGPVSQVDFLAPNVCDGLKPITRLAARICELREQGERIEVIGQAHGCAVYARVEDDQLRLAA